MAYGSPIAEGSPWVTRYYFDDPLIGPIVRPLLFGTGAASYTANPSETVSLAESLAATLDASGSPSETLTLVESLGSSLGVEVPLGETVSLSEALAIVAGMFSALGETPSWSESLSAGMVLTASLPETVTLVEALASNANMSVNLTDLLDLLESVIGSIPRRVIAALLSETQEPQCQVEVETPITIEVTDMSKVYLNQRVELAATFTAAGVAFAPSSVQFTLRRPSGEEISIAHPHADIENPSTGVFKYNVLLDEVGLWRYRWASLATDEEAAQEGSITVPRVLR